MPFTPGEEFAIEAASAILAQQYRFAAVEDLFRPVAMRDERACEFCGFSHQRQPGRGPDHPLTVAHDDRHAVGAPGVGGEILLFIRERSGVEIRKLAEHGDAQAGEVGDTGRERRIATGQDPDVEPGAHHPPTWAIQSCRL